jgi:uncharacterized membrane protein
MYSPITFMPMIWQRLVWPRCATGANRAYNVVDDSDLQMAEYFDRVATAFDLPKPPRISRQEAEATLSPLQMSFMRESRRIGNRRLKNELKLRLAYPSIDDGIAEACAERRNACLSSKRSTFRLVVAWFAGLFYLPRIFVNLAMVAGSVAERERLLLMAASSIRFMTPLGVLAVVWPCGYGWVTVFPAAGCTPRQRWLRCWWPIIGTAVNCYSKPFINGSNTKSHVWFRFYNEMPVMVMFAVIFLVVLKPF